jgi:hypothetical protein
MPSHFSPSARHFIEAGLYYTNAECSNLGSFLDYITNDNTLPFSICGAQQFIDSVLDKNYNTNLDDEIFALRTLIQDDIRKLTAVLGRSGMAERLLEEGKVCNNLYSTLSLAVSILREIDIELEPPELFFVDDYPNPFKGRPAFSMTIDEADSVAFGCAPGIYFLTRSLRPIYSRFLLLQELGHVLISKDRSHLLAGGLEHGLCDIFGSFYLSSKIFGLEFSVNMFVMNRYFMSTDDHFHRHLDHSRRASILLRIFGWSGVFELVKRGRRAVREAEEALWGGYLERVNLTRGTWATQEEQKYIDLCMNTFSNHFNCSPIAKLVSKYAFQGETVRELTHQTKLSIRAVLRGLDELEQRFNLVCLRPDKSVLTFSDCYITNHHPMLLRYEVYIPRAGY